MNIALCTLYEGNYHYGLAALSNSLIEGGFTGNLWAGYRGELPGWATSSPGFDPANARLRVAEGFNICFVLLDTPLHFTYYKATFMQSVLDEHAPDASVVAYIDPDIVVKCKWSDISTWFEGGVALVEDVNSVFPARHPKRLMWANWFAPHGHVPARTLDRYYNAGFMGMPREHRGFLKTWAALCDLVFQYNNGLKHIKSGDAPDLFHSTDQDAMNFALTVHDVPLNTAGPEAMDFATGGYYFSHAIGSPKPWVKGHLALALRGYPPSLATRAYFRFANKHLVSHTPSELTRLKLALYAAGAIARFYRKS